MLNGILAISIVYSHVLTEVLHGGCLDIIKVQHQLAFDGQPVQWTMVTVISFAPKPMGSRFLFGSKLKIPQSLRLLTDK